MHTTSGLEDELDLNDPDIESSHNEFKKRMYQYTVEYQDDREHIDRKVLKKQIGRK